MFNYTIIITHFVILIKYKKYAYIYIVLIINEIRKLKK